MHLISGAGFELPTQAVCRLLQWWELYYAVAGHRTAALQTGNSNRALQHYKDTVCPSSSVTSLMLFNWIGEMHQIFSLTNFHSLQTSLPQPIVQQENYLKLQKEEAGVPDQNLLERDK